MWIAVLGWSAASRAEGEETLDENAEGRHIRDFVKGEFAENTESRHRAVRAQDRFVAERLENVLSDFVDVGGYFRAGFGRNGKGGPMSGFGAPGAASKYRLGNEAENYGELILGKSVYLPDAFRMDEQLRSDGTPLGPVARVQVRLSFFNPYNEHGSAAQTSVGLPEAWAAIGNVIPSQPSAKFWAGNRFYRRHDVHISDFFFWNMSGGGGGIEDVQIGRVKAAFAWIGLGATSGLSYLPEPDPENRAGFSKSSFELRVYEVPMLWGSAEMGLTFATSDSGLDADGNQASASAGAAFNFVHTVPEFLTRDGVNKLAVQYGTGPARTFTSGFETLQVDGATFIRTDPSGAYRLRVLESFTATLGSHFALGPLLLAELTRHQPGAGNQLWLSAGVRPIVVFNRYLNLAFEGGVDWVQDETAGTDGALLKLTVAPQVAIDRFFDSRPVVRAFFTYAEWTQDFVGRVGGLDYVNDSRGINAGVQMEAWW